MVINGPGQKSIFKSQDVEENSQWISMDLKDQFGQV